MLYLIVFLGAGIGGALRHGVNVGAARLLGFGFPFGTLIVNVVMAAGPVRPAGHHDMTLDVAPGDEAIVFNANGAGGRDLYLLSLPGLEVWTPDHPEWRG